MKTLAEYIRAKDMPGTKSCLEEMLKAGPSPELWLKLAMVELDFPFCDEDSALGCCKEAIALSGHFIDAWLLMAYIQWYTTGSAKAAVLDKLSLIAESAQDKARVLFLKALSVWPRSEESEKELLQKSIQTYPHLVWPYVHLGHLCREKALAKRCYQRALENVQHVLSDTELSDHDPTDYKAYILELVDGTRINTEQYRSITEYVQKAEQASEPV